MRTVEVTEHRMLAASHRFASASLFLGGLLHTALVQVLKLPTATGATFSVYAVYREGAMTFEAMSRLEVVAPGCSPGAVLTALLNDPDFPDDLFGPMVSKVDRHFGRRRSCERAAPGG